MNDNERLTGKLRDGSIGVTFWSQTDEDVTRKLLYKLYQMEEKEENECKGVVICSLYNGGYKNSLIQITKEKIIHKNGPLKWGEETPDFFSKFDDILGNDNYEVIVFIEDGEFRKTINRNRAKEKISHK